MPHQHDNTSPLGLLSGSGGSTASGSLFEKIRSNPLGKIGLVLESIIAGSEGRAPLVTKLAGQDSKREFERRRLAILESGEIRAQSAEERATKKAESKEKADALKATKDDLTFRLGLAETFIDAPNKAARDEIRQQIADTAEKAGSPALAEIGKRFEALENDAPAMSELRTSSDAVKFIGKEAVGEVVDGCIAGSIKDRGACVRDGIAKAEDRLFKSLDTSTIIAGISLAQSGASLDGVPPKERAIIEAAIKRGPEALNRLLATVQTRVVQDQPTRNRLDKLRAQEGTLNVTKNLLGGILEKIKVDPTSFAFLGKVKGGFQNLLGVLKDTGDALFPRIQSMVQEAQQLAEREGEPFIISLFTGFNPTIPNAKMVGDAAALLYARSLRGDSERVTRREIELQRDRFDFTKAEALDQLVGRLEAVVNTIIPELQDSLSLQRGIVENPTAAVRDIQELRDLKKKFGLQ